ncbi:MAG: DUF6541 family protein [Candidatus Bathyarchaeia archaeon]
MRKLFNSSIKKLGKYLEKLKACTLKVRLGDSRIRFLIDFLIITVVGLIVFRNFIFSDKWPGGGDVLGMISRAYLYGKDFRWLYVWRMYSFGFPEGINSFDFFLLLFYSVFQNPSATTKAFLFLFFVVAGFSMYAFAYQHTRKHIAALSAALVYILNQWFFSQFTEAHGDIIFSYALAPLIFLLLDRALLFGKLKDIIPLAVFLAVFLTGFHPECVFIYGLFLLTFVSFYILVPTKVNNFKTRIQRVLKVTLSVGALSFLLSAFTLLPLFSNLSPPYYSREYRYYLEEAMGGSFQKFLDAFTLTGIEKWGYGFVLSGPEDIYLPDFPVQAVSAFIFLLAYSTILFRRDRYTYFFAFSTVVSIIISMGPHGLFGEVFVWAWFNVPYFAVFRAASRWVMMAAFSHSFFVSLLVSMLTEHFQKKNLINNAKISPSNFEEIRASKLRIWFTALVDFYQNFHRVFYYGATILLVLILLIGFLSCFFFIRQGLQVSSPPSSYLEPYEWIATMPGNFKVVTVMRSAGEWWEAPGAASDFGYAGMFTDLGWGHDIGYDSAFIHDKPVLQDGGWNPFSRAFVDHLRFRLARENLTDDMLKMLGTFDYKYVVIPSYATANIRNFFLQQQGARIIYNQSSSLIIENMFNTPHIFAATQHAVVVGGFGTFSSLGKIDSFNLNQMPLVFAHQMNEPFFTNPLLNTSHAIIFVDSDILDFVMISLKDSSIMINAAKYSAASMNHTKYWVREPYWRIIGCLLLSRETLTTRGENSVDIPFKVDSAGFYDLWIRLGFAPNRGKLRIFVDGAFCKEFYPYSSSIIGLKWANVSRLNLQAGNHILTLVNDGSGFNDIDVIAIVNPTVFQKAFDEFIKNMQNYSGRLIYVKEAEFLETKGWPLISQLFNGFMLHSEGYGKIISYEGKATTSSVEEEGLTAEKAIDGSKNSRWSSAKGMPQWLQIQWDSTQTISGVHILFERAFAIDYAIQTWNGVEWINQLNVTGNTFQERFHIFPQAVNTTKLRLYITKATEFGTISIWEFEVYSPSEETSLKTEIFIPWKGNYMLATRLITGPDYGVLYVKTNGTEFKVSCEAAQKGFVWREIGPFMLDVGSQEIELKAVGRMDLDTILVYSLKSEETFLSINNLFGRKNASPNLVFERVNPCKYVVHVEEAKEPFLLIFSESYHPLWKAFVEGVEYSPFVSYHIVNGYYIEKNGKFDVVLYFTAQDVANLGLKISLITFISLMIVVVLWCKPLKWLRKLFRRRLGKTKTSFYVKHLFYSVFLS